MCPNLKGVAERLSLPSLGTHVQAGLLISGINAEVMPGQWEFQIGPVGAPDVGDEVMIARWLLHRLGEQFGIVCTFNPKPVKGDWNGMPLR
jgi:glutamine synthetase